MYTLEQYNALCAAIAIGATKVKYGDKDIEYRSLADMKQLKQDMEAQLFGANKNKRKYAEYGRGF